MVPRSVSQTRGLPDSCTLTTACCMASGERNWPFLMLTTLPVCAAATSKSVCRHKNAGICSTSTYPAAIAASSAAWMSVVVGREKRSPTFARISRAFSSPMPVKLSNRERFALRYDPLKISGRSKAAQTSATPSATSMAIPSPSMAQGPAMTCSRLPAVHPAFWKRSAWFMG